MSPEAPLAVTTIATACAHAAWSAMSLSCFIGRFGEG